ncbi:MAG: RagB/SusD family nutrient uptake outer membrane protein, partial [Bacteroidales bacterium]|nr:RagB/SusD family nutrient uptake outer membrane protein [Bacteroidales bacterium]
WSKGWDSKYELMPFPYAQLSANPNLKQNPGW